MHIVHGRQGYSLRLSRKFRLVVPLDKERPTQAMVDFRKIQGDLSSGPMTGVAIQEKLGFSKSKTRSLLEYCAKRKLIEPVGAGAHVRYKLVA